MAELPELEDALISALRSRESANAEDRIEDLIGALLWRFAGISERSIDGYAALREERAPGRYLTVGKMWMVDETTPRPACLELAFNSTGRIVDGRLSFGLVQVSVPSSRAQRRSEAVLEAFPRESVSALPWALELRRTASGWSTTERRQ